MKALDRAMPVPEGATEVAFRRALDRDHVAALVRQHLARAAKVTAIEADYVRWKNVDGSLIGYRATLAIGDESVAGYVTVRTAPLPRLVNEAERLHHRTEDDWAGLCTMALVPDESMLLLALPLDRAMHDLRRLVRASKVRSLVAAVCPAVVPAGFRFSKSRSSFQIVRYKPERRAVLRWQVGCVSDDGRRQTTQPIWIRCHAEAQATRSRIATEAAAAHGITCPRQLGAAHERLLVESHVEGQPWLGGAAADEVAAAARTVARLHAAAAPARLPVLGVVHELDRALRAAEDVARLLPSLAARCRATTDWLRAHVPAATRLNFSHGDLHAGQILHRDDGDAAMCDFDRAVAAPAAHDLATFFAHAVLTDPIDGAALAAGFMDGYACHRPLPGRDEQVWWNKCALLRVATMPFRAMRFTWPSDVERLLGRAEEA